MVDINTNTNIQSKNEILENCTCPICYDKMENDVVKLTCGHSFHYTCILHISNDNLLLAILYAL